MRWAGVQMVAIDMSLVGMGIRGGRYCRVWPIPLTLVPRKGN